MDATCCGSGRLEDTTAAHGDLPIVVIGAGPVGLAAAAHLAARRQKFLVLEAGMTVGTHVGEWGHVQVFSPWRFDVDPVARLLLLGTGWTEPDADALPTGAEIVEGYLQPLAKVPDLEPAIRFGSRVITIARAGHDKMKTTGREQAPFEVRVRTAAGEESLLARAVIDASGTYGVPNPLGANGIPAIGEARLSGSDLLRHPRCAGSCTVRGTPADRVVVVGSGHSAFNALLDLAHLTERGAGHDGDVGGETRRCRRCVRGRGIRCVAGARELGARLRGLVDGGRIRLETGFRTRALDRSGSKIILVPSMSERSDRSTRSSRSPASGRTWPCSASFDSISTPPSRAPPRWRR